MISRLHLSVILFLAWLIWIVLLLVGGFDVSISWLRYLSTVTAVLVLVLGAFDLWLWRLRFLHGWFVKRPDLHGTWRVVMRSNWVEPSTGKTVDPIEGYMAVRQTFSSISLRLMTDESTSELIGAQVVRAQDGTYRVTGVYRNQPRMSVRDRSPIHNGAVLLSVAGSPVTRLSGQYWTDRSTTGEIELTDRSDNILDDFHTARREFQSVRPKGPT